MPRSQDLREGWHIHPSEEGEPGHVISTPGYATAGWTQARVPTTVLAALVARGEYPDLYVADHLERVPRERFETAWWYRVEFAVSPDEASRRIGLRFDGINYRADIWLNGRKIAAETKMRGAFRRFTFDVTSFVRPGVNALALEVHPPDAGDFSTGFVDWNPAPPDRNMGLFRPVRLQFHGDLSLDDPFVTSRLLDNASMADLTVSVRVTNHAADGRNATVRANVAGTELAQDVHIAGSSSEMVVLSPVEHPALRIRSPRLWWPHTLGEPVLHALRLAAYTESGLSDETEVPFGIREISDYFTRDGHRGFRINGEDLLILGAGWTDDLLLRQSPENLEAQLAYVRHMGLNTIRLEGIWGADQTLYDLCDRLGILMMVGWSCHWEHEQYLGKEADERFGGILSDDDIDLVARSWEDQLLWLRHHPSIFTWAVGSDKMPSPELERRYLEAFDRYDRTRPVLVSTAGHGSDEGVITHERIESELTGPSGMKMLGPYDHTPPIYWYTDTTRGGAYGFNTETGPGAQPPVLESILRMVTEAHQWPIDVMWDFHCARNEFDRLDRFVEAMTARLGAPRDLADFDRKAQLLNFELIRPMFEAFRIRRPGATGLIHWMLNSAWPKLYWQLYDYFLVPSAATYAVRRACRPLHLAFDYGTRAVHLVQDGRRSQDRARAEVRLLDLKGETLWLDARDVDIGTEPSRRLVDVPAPASAEVTLLDLRLVSRRGDELDRNTYWLSPVSDELDYARSVEPWPFYTPTGRYADFTALNDLPEAALEAAWCIQADSGSRVVTATVRNRSSHPAFFVEFRLLEAASGKRVAPIFWDDNYITVWPGEMRSVQARVSPDAKPALIEIAGWNVIAFRPEP